MIRAFIFDQDGVLIDSDQFHYMALKETLNTVGITITLNQYTNVCLGKNTEHNIRQFLAANGVDEQILPSLVSRKREIYNKLIKRKSTPMKGVVTALQSLKHHGFKLGVASSSHGQSVNLVLETLGLISNFDVVVHSGMVSELKPNPEIYLLTADLIGAHPQECVAVEDSSVGIESAIGAGMRVIMVRNRYDRTKENRHATWAMENLEQLTPSFLERHVLCIP